MRGGQFFSEYRLRDASNGQEQQLATGVRHAWQLGDGLLVNGGAERLTIRSDKDQKASAVTASVDYTASELWKGSARTEWRRLDGGIGLSNQQGLQDSLLITLGAARKINRDWTALARNY